LGWGGGEVVGGWLEWRGWVWFGLGLVSWVSAWMVKGIGSTDWVGYWMGRYRWCFFMFLFTVCKSMYGRLYQNEILMILFEIDEIARI
jgi:hypothetical protein